MHCDRGFSSTSSAVVFCKKALLDCDVETTIAPPNQYTKSYICGTWKELQTVLSWSFLQYQQKEPPDLFGEEGEEEIE